LQQILNAAARQNTGFQFTRLCADLGERIPALGPPFLEDNAYGSLGCYERRIGKSLQSRQQHLVAAEHHFCRAPRMFFKLARQHEDTSYRDSHSNYDQPPDKHAHLIFPKVYPAGSKFQALY
jgi:hypothetical protein